MGGGGRGGGVLLSADGQNIQDRPAEQTHTIYFWEYTKLTLTGKHSYVLTFRENINSQAENKNTHKIIEKLKCSVLKFYHYVMLCLVTQAFQDPRLKGITASTFK